MSLSSVSVSSVAHSTAVHHAAELVAPGLTIPNQQSSTSILQTLQGKNIFLTGATGFVGKVILEKILRSIPTIAGLYVLVRPRKGSTADERMYKEIVQSEIFARLKQEIGLENFNQLIKNKLHAFGGEMTQSQVGLSPTDLEYFKSNINVIIHCAAIVDFNERLDRAVELNVNGSLRLLQLAQQCVSMDGFIHISTAYVNSNRRGWIDEKIYNLGFDPEEMLNKIGQLKETELEKITGSGILGEWPNTYTFTKAITEALLQKKRGNVPVAIVRPSIVGSSLAEPMPGWVDVITAAGAVYMSVGLGVLKFLPGSENTIADIVPVDYVANAILAAIPAVAKQDKLIILHACTSTERPMHWGDPLSIIVDYFENHPVSRRIADPSFTFISSPQWYQIKFFLQYSVPSSILNVLSAVGTKSYKVKAAQFDKLVFRVRVIIESFRHFVENEWLFSNKNTRTVGLWLNENERKSFPLDLTEIDWPDYNRIFAHGLMRYVLKADLNEMTEFPAENGAVPVKRYENLIVQKWKPSKNNPEWQDYLRPFFPDYNWVRDVQIERLNLNYPQPKTVQQMKLLVLQHPAVQQAILLENKNRNNNTTNSKNNNNNNNNNNNASTSTDATDINNSTSAESRASAICEKMFGDTSLPVISGMGYLFRKIWQRIYNNICVEAAGLNKALQAAKKGPIVFIPTHRSYIDFLIISYICFATGLPIPYIAAGEDFLGILLVRYLFRRSGAFFIRRSLDGDPLYQTIFNVYVQQLLKDGQSLEFFIEGTRSRSGKMLHPKAGLLSMITDVYLNSEIPDCTVIPISINYEKTIESDLYSSELLGDNKIKESLKSLLRSSSVLKVNFGSISVKFNDPISLKEYTASHIKQTPTIPIIENSIIMPQWDKPSSLPPLDNNNNIINNNNNTNIARATRQTVISNNNTTAPARLTVNPNSSSLSSSSSSSSYDPFRNKSDRRYYNHRLAYRIVYDLSLGNEVMPTHIVATLLLMYRQGITKAQLVQKVDWVRKELQSRSAQTYGLEGEERTILVDKAIKALGHVVIQRRSNVFEPAITARSEYPNMLVLGHYRNKLLHYFFLEGLFAIGLYAFGDLIESGGVTVDALLDEVNFLYALLHREFIYKANPDEPDDLQAVLQIMIGRGILKLTGINQNYVEVAGSGEAHFSFLCALFWPFVDSYYTAAMILFSLQPSRVVEELSLLQRTQWLATTLYHESMLSFYESCSLDTLRNAFDTLKQWGCIKMEKVRSGGRSGLGSGVTASLSSQASSNKVMVSLLPPYTEEAKLQQLVNRIGRLRKQPPVRKNAIRRNLIADIPILAKL